MANTLTGLIPSIYGAFDTVSRELTGFIPAVRRDASADRAAVGQAVTYPITPEGNSSNVAPAMTVPEPTGQTVTNDSITISKSKTAEFGFVGEEKLGLDNNGAGFNVVQADMISQAVRVLANEIESDLGAEAHANASRAVGVAGTTPFGSDVSAVSDIRKVLVDNGSPQADMQLVTNTTSGASLRTLYGINADRDFSTQPMNERGVIATPHGVAIRESQYDPIHTAGDAASSTSNATGYAVGSTQITLASAGTGAILAGDVITFAGDANQYVVEAGVADVSAGGVLTIQEPGLRVALPAAATAVTVVSNGGTYGGAGIAFYRNALMLAARSPALPEEGDMAADRMTIIDPVSGLPFEFSLYLGYRKVRYEVALAWGVKATQPRHTALLLG